MILILSDHNDNSTTDIVDWLICYNVTFVRINGCDIEGYYGRL